MTAVMHPIAAEAVHPDRGSPAPAIVPGAEGLDPLVEALRHAARKEAERSQADPPAWR